MIREVQTTTQQTQETSQPEVSIVIPCLNEENSIGIVIEKAWRAIEIMGTPGEVIVADNGSTDRSVEIALSKGARVVHVQRKGYGSALRGGIEAAKGRIIVIGDADDSYDFLEAPKLVEKIKEGYDLVVGSRFKGRILPGAMPWTSKIGNPIMTGILNLLFRVNTSDSQSGMRAFTKEAYRKMQLQATGMEFASEMLIKAGKAKLRVAEVPITLHPDKRGRPPHLRPIRDGWRHLKLMLTYSPTVLFLMPGMSLIFLGLLLMGVHLLAPMDKPLTLFGKIKMDFHWAFVGSLLTLTGYQVINAHFMAKIYSIAHRFQEEDKLLQIAFRYLNAERVLALSLLVIAAGLTLDGWVLVDWIRRGYHGLVSGHTRLVIFGSTLIALGVQTFFNAFIFSIISEGYQRNFQPRN